MTTEYVTFVKGKEHFVGYRTNHSNPVLKQLYVDFKMAENKLQWLIDNHERLVGFNINTQCLGEAYSENDWDWVKAKRKSEEE
jgi:hypothetical protein